MTHPRPDRPQCLSDYSPRPHNCRGSARPLDRPRARPPLCKPHPALRQQDHRRVPDRGRERRRNRLAEHDPTGPGGWAGWIPSQPNQGPGGRPPTMHGSPHRFSARGPGRTVSDGSPPVRVRVSTRPLRISCRSETTGRSGDARITSWAPPAVGGPTGRVQPHSGSAQPRSGRPPKATTSSRPTHHRSRPPSGPYLKQPRQVPRANVRRTHQAQRR